VELSTGKVEAGNKDVEQAGRCCAATETVEKHYTSAHHKTWKKKLCTADKERPACGGVRLTDMSGLEHGLANLRDYNLVLTRLVACQLFRNQMQPTWRSPSPVSILNSGDKTYLTRLTGTFPGHQHATLTTISKLIDF